MLPSLEQGAHELLVAVVAFLVGEDQGYLVGWEHFVAWHGAAAAGTKLLADAELDETGFGEDVELLNGT